MTSTPRFRHKSYCSRKSTPHFSVTKLFSRRAHNSELDEVESKLGDYQPREFTLRGMTYCDAMQCPLPSVELFKGTEITFTTPSSHNVLLDWEEIPTRVLFLAKLDQDNYQCIRDALLNLFRRRLEVVIEESLLDFLLEQEQENNHEHLIKTAATQLRTAESTLHSTVNKNVTTEEQTLKSAYGTVIPAPEQSPEFILFSSKSKVDLIVTFGGDGLLLHCNTLFGERSVPPIMSFDFGSLGFLSPFLYENFDDELDFVLKGNVVLTLRMRLECTIWHEQVPSESFCVLNEAVIDRGPSPYLSVLDLSCDNQYITTLQGDGIIIATPTGSTAYSLAAGGSVVYPSVPAILLTPVCAHSLSFRPMLLPDTAVLTCSVPEECRSNGWVSFDGKFRRELTRGDWLEVRMSPHPLPTVNRKNFTGDWLDSLRAGFMYNVRKRQKPR